MNGEVKIERPINIATIITLCTILVSVTLYIAGQEKNNAVQDTAIEANKLAILAEERARREAIAALAAQHASERQEMRELFNKIEVKIDKISEEIRHPRPES